MKRKTLYAIDIINPFSKTVKMDGLNELLNRILIDSYFDKAGQYYYKITWQIKENKIPDTDLVINFLNDISKNNQHLCNSVNFKLDTLPY